MKQARKPISTLEKLGSGINAAVRRIALEYTDRGQLSKVSSHNNATVGSGTIVNQVALSYNAFNQLIEDAQSHSGAVAGGTPKISYSYANGTANQTRRLTTTYPSDKIITMSYGTANSANDRLSRLAGVALTGETDPLGEFAWMGAGRLISLTMPQPGIALSYKHAAGQPVGDSGDPYSGYDRFGRTVDMRWIKTSDQSSLSRIQYGYDKMSRRLWRQDLAAPADTKQDRFYSYDGLGQVTDSALGNLNINRTSIAGIPAQREAFDYDAIGNWKDYLRQSEGTTTLDQKRTHNRDNQLTELDANSDGIAYDAAGNMTACRPDKDGDWSKGYTIVWDAWNRIVQVKNAQTSATVASYAYDGLTRPTTTTIGSTVRRFFYNDVWKCVEERLGSSSNPDRLYFWSSRTGHRDELLRRDRATSGGALNETLWCLMDYFDPIAIASGSGEIQERYTYTAFGLASILTPAFAARAATNFAWNFLFHGQFRDTETGWDNYGYRSYLPWLGRWLSRDPLEEKFLVNVYQGSNNFVNGVDYFGLAENECSKGDFKSGAQKNIKLNTVAGGALDDANLDAIWKAVGLMEAAGNLGPGLSGNVATAAAGTANQASGSMTDLGKETGKKIQDKQKEAMDALKNMGFQQYFWTGDQEYKCCICPDGAKKGKWSDPKSEPIRSANFNDPADMFTTLRDAIIKAQDKAKAKCAGE
jgi:RHS repeat-associated protein